MEKRQLALATRTSGTLLEVQAGTGHLGLVLEMGLLFMLLDARVAVVVGRSSFCKPSGTFFMLSDEAFGRELRKIHGIFTVQPEPFLCVSARTSSKRYGV